MCNAPQPKEAKDWLTEKQYRLADFFDRWWDSYKQNPAHYLTEEQYKAVNALRCCRTEAYGVDHYVCPDCGEITQIYHSCKNRFCPTCSWKDTMQWAEKIKSQMLALPHRHVVVTLPHQLNGLIKRNGKELLDILLRTSSDIFKDWMGHKYHLKPGIISVLHTFGETKEYHCHVHMIVSWGGIDKATNALKPIKGTYVNYDFLKAKFRHKFEDRLVAMFDDELLQHSFPDRVSFMRFLKRINQKRWVLHLEPPMEIPTQVIRYIGRYSKRACLSEYKITKMEGETISFRYKDYKNKDIHNKPIERELELHYRDFFPRLLQHVPLKYFRLVRYYGLYATRSTIPGEYLYMEEKALESVNKDHPESLSAQNNEENPLVCSHCNTRKVYLHTTIKNRNKRELVSYQRACLINDQLPIECVA